MNKESYPFFFHACNAITEPSCSLIAFITFTGFEPLGQLPVDHSGHAMRRSPRGRPK